jgi:hypothetical protein
LWSGLPKKINKNLIQFLLTIENYFIMLAVNLEAEFRALPTLGLCGSDTK